jgi:predicted RNA-binding protein YlxR (DUF448 family)
MKMAILPEVESEAKDAQSDERSVCRICVACRKTYKAESLLRFVISPRHELVFDVKGFAPGRGAYVCANETCFQNAVKKKSFNRSFRGSILVDYKNLKISVKERLQKSILDNLGLAFCAEQCVVGRSKVNEASVGDKIKAIIMACDLSIRSVNELDFKDVPILTGPFKTLIGQSLGRSVTGVVALLKGRISDRIVCDLLRWQFLSSPGKQMNEEIFNG